MIIIRLIISKEEGNILNRFCEGLEEDKIIKILKHEKKGKEKDNEIEDTAYRISYVFNRLTFSLKKCVYSKNELFIRLNLADATVLFTFCERLYFGGILLVLGYPYKNTDNKSITESVDYINKEEIDKTVGIVLDLIRVIKNKLIKTGLVVKEEDSNIKEGKNEKKH